MAGSSARRSLSSSAAPSTFAALANGGDRSLAATARAAAKDRNADQRDTYAAVAPVGSRGGAGRARLRARRPDELCCFRAPFAADLNSTHDQAAARRPEQLRVSAFLGTCRAAPDVRLGWWHGCPAESKAETKVVSTASCAPAQRWETISDDPAATVTMLCSDKIQVPQKDGW